MRFKISKRLFQASLLILTALIIYSCARNPVTGKRQVMLVSEAQELAMGVQSDPAIVANYGLYQDENMQSFISTKGVEMGKISHRPDLEYSFKVLDSPVVNAFAVPGGFIYFTRGIMAHFNSEAEFAGVLGHEIGHVTARHSAAQLSKQQLYGGLMMAGMILSPEFRQFSDAAQQGLGLMFLKFGRSAESESDMLGVEYSTKIGYDAHQMADFFGVLSRIQQQSGQSIPDFLSTHPNPADRFNNVHRLADEAQAQIGDSNLAINRNSYLRMIDGIIYGEDPTQGYVADGTFFHPELKFQFPVPGQWRLVNTPQMVQMAAADGKAIMMMTLAGEGTLQEAAQATAEKDQLQVVESANVNVNGLPAIAMISQQDQKDQATGQIVQSLRILTYLIQYNGLIYKFHGLSKAEDFNSYYNLFSSTMTNFRVLTNQSRINVFPTRVKIETIPSAMTLSQALMRFNQPQDQLETIAILNNMQLTDQLSPGTLIKTLSKRK